MAFTHHLTKSQPKSRPAIDERKTLKNVVLVSTIKYLLFYYYIIEPHRVGVERQLMFRDVTAKCLRLIFL